MLQILKKTYTLRGLKKDLRILKILFLKKKRRKIIKTYLAKHPVTKLHLGSNRTLLKGWLCSDIVPQNNQSIFLDVTQKFPFKDNSFDYIYSEHLIEHLKQEEGIFMLHESYRVLKKDGRIRIATPDMDVIIRLYTERNRNFGGDYIRWSIDNFSGQPSEYDPVVVVNNLFHYWGHSFLYDFNYLKKVLVKCGFSDIERFTVSQSKDIHLQNIERHHENVGSLEMVKFETLVIEAVKK